MSRRDKRASARFRQGCGGSKARLPAASSAADAGHEIVVLAPDQFADQSTTDRTLPYRVIRYPGGPASMKSLLRRIVETRKLLRSERFDIVHAADWPFFIPLRLMRGLQPHARKLLTVHGSETVHMRAPKRRALLGAIGLWRPGWAEWIANSLATRTMLLEGFVEVRSQDVRAIPLALSTGWLAGRIDRDTARRAYGAGDDFIIISLGRVVPRKGHADLADALARLPEAIAGRVRWWIVGPLPEPEHEKLLRSKAQTLRARMEILGKLPLTDVQRRLSASDLFCLPGYRDEGGRVEGFGFVFLEAGAYAVPSVATRSGGISEAIDEGVSGLLVDERDVLALTAAIEKVIEDPALRADLARGAKRKAEATTWHDVMMRTYGRR